MKDHLNPQTSISFTMYRFSIVYLYSIPNDLSNYLSQGLGPVTFYLADLAPFNTDPPENAIMFEKGGGYSC